MTPNNWDPLHDMQQLLASLNQPSRAAQNRPAGGHENVTTADWVPAVDIVEMENEYCIKVELPEVAKEDVKLSVHAGVLVIHGTREVPQPGKMKLHRMERGHGRFARSFSLPDDVEEDKISAEQKHGLLLVHLPKHRESPAKSIEIKVK